jgi:hypothetical protein
MGGAYNTNVDKRHAIRVLVGEPKGERLPGRPRHGWVNNMERNIGETEWDTVHWIDLAQDSGYWKALVITGSVNRWDGSSRRTHHSEVT